MQFMNKQLSFPLCVIYPERDWRHARRKRPLRSSSPSPHKWRINPIKGHCWLRWLQDLVL